MSRHLNHHRVLPIWLPFLLFAPAQAADLLAGVAKVTIPASAGCELAGSKRRAVGVHDPLQARALVLRTATASLALVACDLHSFPSKRIASEARSRLGIGLVVLACSGSHAAPGIASRWPGSEVWTSEVENAILDAIAKANSSLFPARLGSAAVPVNLGYNWRLIDEYGKVTMLWRNPERRPTGPLVNSAAVWRIDDTAGVMRAVMFHAGCRASVRGSESLEISADYPGAAARRVESELGGGVVSLFLQGASGNVVPYEDEQAGDALGRKVAAAARAIAAQAELEPSLQVYRDPMTLHARWGSRRSVAAETATVVINRKLALATMPGAPFVEHQIALRDRSLVPGTVLVGHAFTGNSEWLGIVPTIRGAAEGGYGASGGDTLVEAGAGEAMVDTALANIYRALGKLDTLPRGDLVRDTPPEGKKR